MRALSAAALLALACTDPGLVGIRGEGITIEAIAVEPGNPPILIDWSRPKEGLYRTTEVVYWAGGEVETACSYAVIEWAPNAHRADGKGTWGRIMLVVARKSSRPGSMSVGHPVEAWAAMGDTMLTRLGLNSEVRWRHFGDGLEPGLVIEGVGTRRRDHDFRLVLEWAQELKPDDFNELYWPYIMQCAA